MVIPVFIDPQTEQSHSQFMEYLMMNTDRPFYLAIVLVSSVLQLWRYDRTESGARAVYSEPIALETNGQLLYRLFWRIALSREALLGV